jgi:DNA-binding protein H-NS
MATYRNLKAQITKLEKQAADLFKKEVADVVAKIHGLMSEYDLTVADLGLRNKAGKVTKTARKTKKPAKPAGVPKYRDPVSGKTWTGFGKAPGWLVEGIKKGKSKDDFLIGKTAAKATAKPVAKAAKGTKATKVAKPANVTTATRASKIPVARKPAAKKPALAAKPAKAAVKKVPPKKAPAKKAAAKVPVAPAATDKA